MSEYTTELRFICESLNGDTESSGYNKIQEIINNTYNQIFSFDYPIFDSTYKPVLEKKIIKHFYTREIAFETYGRWKLALDAKMNEIMPYYNQLYNSELIEFNPLYDVDQYTDSKRTHDDEINETQNNIQTDTGTVTTDNDGTITTKQTGTIGDVGTNSSIDSGSDVATRRGGDVMDRWDKYSDTPQGTVHYLNGVSTDALHTDGYLTDARHITENHSGAEWSDTTEYGKHNNGTDNNTRTYNTTSPQEINTTQLETLNTKRKNDNKRKHEYDSIVDYSEHVLGKSPGKSYSRMLNEFRDTFLNIDMLIIDELEGLFMQIW